MVRATTVKDGAMQRTDLVHYLDSYLQVAEIDDVSANGLQVEGSASVQRLAFAVDACQAAIEAAVTGAAQMLIVHHGLFWGQPVPVVGPHRRRVKALLDADCSLYAVHVPLDIHPVVGNAVCLARLLGLSVLGDFGTAGVEAHAPAGLTLTALAERAEALLGASPNVLAGGPGVVQRVGIVTGRAPREIARAAEAGYDTLVTGEPLHDIYHHAIEYGINVIFAGHYATETVGLRALADHLHAQFELETMFIDLPTGL
jgi:dinuclear metal center YbgI/SA1388 family protein